MAPPMEGVLCLRAGGEFDLNLTTWMRTSVGASFRVVSGLHSDAATNRDLSGPSAMISFRFGSF